MIEAGGWGLLAASSLVFGAILSFTGLIGGRLLRLVTAFGAGVLISAVAYDLVEEAVLRSADGFFVGAGLVLGSLAFYGGSALVERWTSARSHGTGILFGAGLDGIPESIVLGVSLLAGGGISVAVLVAIFISNVPEAIAASAGLTTAGIRRGRIIGIWIVVVLVCGVAAAIGYAALGKAGPDPIGFIEAFAAGAILTMLADDMIPAAFAEGDKLPGVATAAGFAVAALLSFST